MDRQRELELLKQIGRVVSDLVGSHGLLHPSFLVASDDPTDGNPRRMAFSTNVGLLFLELIDAPWATAGDWPDEPPRILAAWLEPPQEGQAVRCTAACFGTADDAEALLEQLLLDEAANAIPVFERKRPFPT